MYMCFILASKTCDYHYRYKWCPGYNSCEHIYYLCEYYLYYYYHYYGDCGYNTNRSRCCKFICVLNLINYRWY